MAQLPHGGHHLGRIHRRNNDNKFYCHFTGFLEGIIASGLIEQGEYEPLIAECIEFVQRASDGDATDIIEDFKIDALEYEMINTAVEIRLEAIDKTCKKSRLNRFLGFCRGIVCDGVITVEEAEKTVQFLNKNVDMLDVVGVRQIYISCCDAISDGIIDPGESQEISDVIGHVVGDCYGDTGLAHTAGVANFLETKLESLDTNFEGAIIVLTGNFKTYPRRLLEEQLAGFGAIIARHVSGKTNYVIIGGEASRDWIEMNRGTKIRKAQELRLNSEKPLFLSESQILRMIEN